MAQNQSPTTFTTQELIDLIIAENWTIENRKVTQLVKVNVNEVYEKNGIKYNHLVPKQVEHYIEKLVVLVYDSEFDIDHPYNIHKKLILEYHNPELKYRSYKRIHDMMFPTRIETWNYWEERVLRTFCDYFDNIVLAGGANLGKSDLVGRIALMFYAVAPTERAGLISSTTLDAVSERIWGYTSKFMRDSAIPLNYHLTKQPLNIRINPHRNHSGST